MVTSASLPKPLTHDPKISTRAQHCLESPASIASASCRKGSNSGFSLQGNGPAKPQGPRLKRLYTRFCRLGTLDRLPCCLMKIVVDNGMRAWTSNQSLAGLQAESTNSKPGLFPPVGFFLFACRLGPIVENRQDFATNNHQALELSKHSPFRYLRST